MEYDFSGWATKNNILCSDGRTIMKDAFKHHDGQKVPLVWNHQHNFPDDVLGHALLENREEGVYAYCSFNDSDMARAAREAVKHGDVTAMSIYANKLKQMGSNVVHGAIREVSLVLAGANPGAFIDSVLTHGDSSEEEGVIYTGEYIALHHAEEQEDEKEEIMEKEQKKVEEPVEDEQSEEVEETEKKAESEDEESEEEVKHAEESERTIQDVIDTMTEEQKNVMYALIGMAVEDENKTSEGGNNMKHNVFDEETKPEGVLSHADMQTILASAKRYGSLKDAVLAHADGDIEYSPDKATYGIDGADNWLFPDARLLNTPPEFIKRKTDWVAKVLGGTHHTPFSRIKSMFADITEEDARAKGYIKGKMKKEEFFGLVKRTTTPTTIYKKQKMDRDDVIDITDFDVVAWLKSEMRLMLDEEIARAILIGDGRDNSSDDKINEQNIRPIWTDADLFTIKKLIEVAEGATEDEVAKQFIRASIKARKEYKGSGEPVLFTTEDMLTDMLLMEDKMGRVIYDSVEKLKNALRVKDIITVPVMENQSREDGGVNKELMGIIVNLKDYNVGADKGGAVNMFDDFDIDYNQQKYLIETRCSGALIKPYSAIVIEKKGSEVAAG